MQFITVGTCGHVDHGKTTLIKVLTGIDTDRLPQEKERGMTIDLGFANLSLTPEINLSFIDVPGHEKFLKNMLAGITSIKYFMLVIAANEGIMPQTTEHLQILKLLNLQKGMVILTKVDLVEPQFLELLIEDIKNQIKDYLPECPIIKFSALTLSGKEQIMAIFKQEFAESPVNHNFSDLKIKKNIPVFPVDRSFTVKGIGTVVTGTLAAGEIGVGDLLQLIPSLKVLKVKQIQIHNNKVSSAVAGNRAALNLNNIDCGEISRGNLLIGPDSYTLTEEILIEVNLLTDAVQELKTNSRIRFYYLSSEIIGRINLIGKKKLFPGESCFAVIKLEKPVVVPHNTLFIIRNYSPMYIIGGGTVLNPYPDKKRLNIEKRLEIARLYARRDYSKLINNYINQQKEPFKLVNLKNLIPPEQWAQILADLKERLINLGNNFYFNKIYFIEKQKQLLAFFEDFHRDNPGKIGVDKHFLQNIFKFNLLMLEALLKDPLLEITNGLYYLNYRKIKLSEAENKLKESILLVFNNEKYQSLKDLEQKTAIKLPQLKELLQQLIIENKIEPLQQNVYVVKENWNQAVAMIIHLINTEGRITTSQAREYLSTSRKYIIPILETLDKKLITKRQEDFRILYK